MASVRQPKRAGVVEEGVWQGVAQVGGGRQRVKTFRGRGAKAAALHWAGVEEKRARRAAGLPAAERLTVAEVWDRACGEVGETERYRQEVARTGRVYVLPAWGRLRVADLDPADVQAWVRRLHGGGRTRPRTGDRLPDRHGDLPTVSAQRAATVLAHLKAVLARAVELGVLDEVPPLGGVRRPSVPPPRPRFMPEESFLAALVHAPAWAVPVLYGIAYTGMRIGELAGLERSAVALGGRSVLVTEVLVEDDRCRHSVKEVSKGGRDRSVFLPSHVLDVWERADGGHGPLVLPRSGGGRPVTVAPWFRMPGGQPVCRHRLRAVWVSAQHAAGLGQVHRPYDLRHLYASLLLTSGHSLSEVGEQLGHARGSRVTGRDYAALIRRRDEDLARTLDRPAWGSGRASVSDGADGAGAAGT